MAFVVKDRVKETTLTTGTGTITLAGAVIGYQTFSAIGDGNNTFYTIAGQATSEWEVGIGTYTASGTTLSRDTILASSNSGSAVNFSAGTKDVFVTYPAGKAIFQNNLDSVVVAANTSSDALRITQTGSGNALLVEDSSNPDATPVVIDSDGRLLLGRQSVFTGIGAILQLSGTAPNYFARRFIDTNEGSAINLGKARGTADTPVVVQANDTVSNMQFWGYDGTNFILAATIASFVDGTPGTNDMPGRLIFQTTADGASSVTERMRIDSAGRVGIGGVPFAGANFVIPKTVTGATNSYQLNSDYTVASDVTSSATTFFSYVQTQAAAFTLGSLNHFFASQRAIGAGSTITNQYGFVADASLTGATNNYGFLSSIASGTGRWNFYANGTAQNYFEGLVGLKTTANNGGYLEIGGTANVVSNSGYGVTQYQTIPSTATSQYWLNTTVCSTAAASFTLSDLRHYNAGQGTFGAGSTVTSQYGFFAQSNLTGATNNYGFYSNIASGTGRWNFYAGGTAQNYFAGTTLIGTTTNTNSSTLVVNGTISQTVSSTQYLVVDQSDIGTGANEIPLNQYLGANAYVDTETPALNIGTGITTGTGTICRANGGLSGGIYRMTILIDLTGLNSGGTAGDIIGVNGTALPCYIAQLPAMTVLGGRMTCLETPAGGDTDIDLYSATEGTGVEDQAITALTETEIINAGAQTRGTVTYFSADPATNAYFYLVGQGTANATYTAGRFLIEIFGVQ